MILHSMAAQGDILTCAVSPRQCAEFMVRALELLYALGIEGKDASDHRSFSFLSFLHESRMKKGYNLTMILLYWNL